MIASLDGARLDRASVRRAFERAAGTYDSAAVLQREVGQRMAERLGIVRLDPAAILDAGCGTGEALGELHARYPRAQLVGLDLAYPMLQAARRRDLTARADAHPLVRRLLGAFTAMARGGPGLVCADVCRLPLGARSVDLVWSNLTLQWVDELPLALAEFHRVLKVGGLLPSRRSARIPCASCGVRSQRPTGARTSIAFWTCTTSATCWCKPGLPIR